MLGWDGELPQPTIRTMNQMRTVLASPSCDSCCQLYYMYRDLAKTDEDWEWFHRHHLRYDLTVIPPADLCGERIKTKGHYHPANPAGVGYPEIYEVLEGRAQYLLQSRRLDEVIIIDAAAGDLVIIPSGYGHTTINPSPDKTLAMANIVSTEFESEYGEYESLHGAAYYIMTSGMVARNPHYPEGVPAPRHISQANGRGTHRICKGPLYSLAGNEGALAFLNNPERFLTIFDVLLKG
jgi:glucose-6-phosphate isomerase